MPNERASTCEIRMRDGRLPNLRALALHLQNMRVGATLRGVEVTVDGYCIRKPGEVWLQVTGTGERVRLTPLRRKVQFDKEKARPQEPTERERTAYTRLLTRTQNPRRVVRIVGPLVQHASGESLTLEVREFTLPR